MTRDDRHVARDIYLAGLDPINSIIYINVVQASATDIAGACHHLHAVSPRKKLKIPTMAEPAPISVRSHQM